MAVLIYSGGTTGVAKGIMLSHYALVANAHQLQAWVNLDAEGRMLAVLPLFHGFGMSVTMNAPLLAGAEIVLMPRFQAKTVLKTIQKIQADLLRRRAHHVRGLRQRARRGQIRPAQRQGHLRRAQRR